VDDEPAIRALVKSILSNHGFSVLEAHDGQHAISLLKDQSVGRCLDLMVTDIQMPGADGVLVAQTFMMMSPQARVILMSGYADVESINSESPERWCFVAKPFLPQTLVEAIERVGLEPDPI
jgi:DNA-binding NtrC family response regulator